MLLNPVADLADAKGRLETVRELIDSLATGGPFSGRQGAIAVLFDVSQFLKRLINKGDSVFTRLQVETQ